MIMPLSATKPRKKCAICKHWDGEKPEIPVFDIYFVEKENEGCCSCEKSANCNSICGAMQECEQFELDDRYNQDNIIKCREQQTHLHFTKDIQSFNNKTAKEFPSLEEITVDEENKFFCEIDGVLYTKDMTHLIAYPSAKEDYHFQVPYVVESLLGCDFALNPFLHELSMPDTCDCDFTFDIAGSNIKTIHIL